MSQIPEVDGLELIYIIVNHGAGSKVLQLAKAGGISGGTVFLGKGTVHNRLLEMLALSDIQKEIVLVIADREAGSSFLEKLNKEHKLYKPNHGIAFCVPIIGICASKQYNCNTMNECGGRENTMYQSVVIIVDKGKGGAVVDAATRAGSKGATIINARGSGIHETSKLFAMEVEPEKEIVLMITKHELTHGIVASIRESLQIDKPGNGIIFVQDVSQTYGLFEE